MKTLAAFGLLGALLLVAGCGGSQTMRVWGDVTCGDKPIQEGEIVFTPVEGTLGSATGGVIKDGTYNVPAEKGLVPNGVYKVEIKGFAKTGRKAVAEPGSVVETVGNFVPAIYNTKSTLKVTISTRSSENQHNFTLKAK